jgi:BASS family bile acid:Na+ symporter
MELFNLVYHLSVLIFVAGSMIAMGLSLTVGEIVEPIRNIRLVAIALIANFVAVPLFASLLIFLLPISLGVEEGIILLSLAAGAPFLPKLAYIAKSDPALSIGLMLVLMLSTVIIMPIVLPHMLPNTLVDALAIARTLVLTMLLPLFSALLLKHYWRHFAAILYPFFVWLSDLAIISLAISLVVLYGRELARLWGWGLLAIMLFLVGTIVIGYLFGGKSPERRFMLSIATAQRNISAAVLVAAQNFTDPTVTVTMVAAALLGLLLMLPYAHQRKQACRAELLEEEEEMIRELEKSKEE